MRYKARKQLEHVAEAAQLPCVIPMKEDILTIVNNIQDTVLARNVFELINNSPLTRDYL